MKFSANKSIPTENRCRAAQIFPLMDDMPISVAHTAEDSVLQWPNSFNLHQKSHYLTAISERVVLSPSALKI